MKEFKIGNYKNFLELLFPQKCITHRGVFRTPSNIYDRVFDENNWHLGNRSLVSQKNLYNRCFERSLKHDGRFLLMINMNRTSIDILWPKCRN